MGSVAIDALHMIAPGDYTSDRSHLMLPDRNGAIEYLAPPEIATLLSRLGAWCFVGAGPSDGSCEVALRHFVDALAQTHGRTVPLFVKIAPDLDGAQVTAIAARLRANRIDGVIATNTTIARDAVAALPHGAEAGGLSGAPVFAASNRVIAQLRAALGAGFPIIGVGGVMSGADAKAKLAAGADLVQIYTGFIYEGPELVTKAARATATP
jgi:dihydroorotate dehydrogenase